MSILYVDIDLAKNVFAVHGVNEAGAAELRQPKLQQERPHPVGGDYAARRSMRTT